MRNLPFFQLLEAVEKPGIVLPGPVLHSFKVLTPVLGHRWPAKLFPTEAYTFFGVLNLARSIFPGVFDSMAGLLPKTAVPKIAAHFRIVIPERYEGDLVHKLDRVLDYLLPVSATLPWLLSVVAFLATNNSLTQDQMDTFLRWIVDQGHAESLEVMLKISTPTVHAFVEVLLNSVIRIRSVQVLNILLDCGAKPHNKLLEIAQDLGDDRLTRRVLADANPVSLAESGRGADTLHYFVKSNQFDMAQLLLEQGVAVDARSSDGEGSALHRAVLDNNMTGTRFLVDAGANVDLLSTCTANGFMIFTTPLGCAVFNDSVEAVALLLERRADVGAMIEGKTLIEWAALSSRIIYDLLKKRMAPSPTGFLLGDLVDAANRGRPALEAYLGQHPMDLTKHRLEKALKQSILRERLVAAVTLLQHRVSPDGLTLKVSPFVTALRKRVANPLFVGLLLGHNANLARPEILNILSSDGPSDLLEISLASGVNREHRMKALVRAAGSGNLDSAAILIRSGLDINTPGLSENPLQAACALGHIAMIRLLVCQGANVNAPAHWDRGRTALQAALESKNPVESARMLLDHGAGVSAPPARSDGPTALEALCHNRKISDSEGARWLCHELLDRGATVNRPGGEASSAIHGIVRNGWHDVLARCLEPQHSAITHYMWCERIFADPITPTQLAASSGDLKALTMLLDHGADVKEANEFGGRTALQGAALLKPGPTKMAIISLLLQRSANINAKPACTRGVTPLQAAAISGDILLAELLISRGADVNEWTSPIGGCNAIEGVSEHGCLDMVQLLLNAGAKGAAFHGEGFQRAVQLAEKNGHFAVASLLKERDGRAWPG